MTDVVPNHILLLNNNATAANGDLSPYPRLDSLLQQWTDDIMTHNQKETLIHWQPPVSEQTLESFTANTVLWGQTLVQGINNPPQAAPVVLLAMDALAARLIIESFLGSQSMASLPPSHQHTLFEQNLIERFCTNILNVLSHTWRNWETTTPLQEDVTFQCTSIAHTAPFLGRTYEDVIAWPLKIRNLEDEAYGTCYFIVPHITAEPLSSKLHERFADESLNHDKLWQEHWQNTISEAICDIEVRMPSMMCDLRDVLKWQEGSKISISSLTISHAYCHDQHIMTGSVGHKNGHMAFQMQSFDIYNERNYS